MIKKFPLHAFLLLDDNLLLSLSLHRLYSVCFNSYYKLLLDFDPPLKFLLLELLNFLDPFLDYFFLDLLDLFLFHLFLLNDLDLFDFNLHYLLHFNFPPLYLDLISINLI